MKDIHRNVKLDALIGEKVTVMFCDTSFAIGILGYCEKTDLYKGLRAGYYFIDRPNGAVCFRKSIVKKVWITGTTGGKKI